MGRIRVSSLVLGVVFLGLLAALLLLRQSLWDAHVDESIFYVASDAPTYFNAYQLLYSDALLGEHPELFLVGSPILFMKLADGNLLIVQLCNLALMAATLKTALGCFSTRRGRLTFIAAALAFPYFLFGFLSLNKEVYAMCSAILFAVYFVRGGRGNLVWSLVLAACARYYMLVALLLLVLMVPRTGPPRRKLIAFVLLAISVAAPIAKAMVPQYSSEDLLEAPSFSGVFFSTIIDSFGYALIYPLKYLALIPMRAYSFLQDAGRVTDAMEAAVSVLSLVVLVQAIRVLTSGSASTTVRRLIIAAFVAPVPIMWSEIMHWRYYSFVYFFFLTAIVLHAEQRQRSAQRVRTAMVHA